MKKKYQFIFFVFLISVFQPAIVVGQDHNDLIALSIKPKECVVFKEGDKCYASVNVKWKVNSPGSFCLFRTPDDIKLECWNGVSEGDFSEELVMREPVNYYLVRADNPEILIQKTVNLSWVYKKSSRPEHTWRLF